MTDVPPHTVRAYRETDYLVDDAPPFTLRIGKRSEALAAVHVRAGVHCSAFITACNPFSEPLADADNAARQSALVRLIRERGLPFIVGIGRHPANGWPGEPSVLILGLAQDEACEFGRQFGQNAIVWCGEDAVPALMLLR